MVLERRRRFAGEGFGMGGDQAAALREATEQLKAAQEALKQQQAAGTTTTAAAPSASVTTAATPATGTTDIAGLRKQLGIDDLMSSIGSLKTQQAETAMPQFEMPQFEMPQFEMPDWSSMMPDFGSLLQQYLPQQQAGDQGSQQQAGDQGLQQQQQLPSAITPKDKKPGTAKQPRGAKQPGGAKKDGLRINVGDTKYNLSTTGGAGLGMQDIKNLQQMGLKKSDIRKAAEQTKAAGKSVSKGAQTFLNKATQPKTAQPKANPSAAAKAQAKSMTTTARKAIATAAKPAAKPAAAKPAARPAAARPAAAKPAARPAAARPAAKRK